jgi:hypothetical protein
MVLALWLVVAASACHIVEEYLWPGGFLDAMRRTAPALKSGGYQGSTPQDPSSSVVHR